MTYTIKDLRVAVINDYAKLLPLLLLTQLLASTPAEAFFGWGKFSSKMEAKAACDEWVKNGAIETYEAQVPLPKAERDERIRIAKETIDKQEKTIDKK